MRDDQLPEAPLDLLQAARDELIQGSDPVHLAPQTALRADPLEPIQPKHSRRCDTAQREVVEQSAVLSADPVVDRSLQKPC